MHKIKTTFLGKRKELSKPYNTKAEAEEDAQYLKKRMGELRKRYGKTFAVHTNIRVVRK